MKEVFEKIKNRFKEKRDKYENLADSSNFHGYHEEELKYFGMQEAYEEAIEMVDQVAEECKNKYVSIGAYKQVAWERDIAIEQLHELGYEFGEKIRDKTHGDRIRAMNDEALAEYLERILACDFCPVKSKCDYFIPCEENLLKWLQSEVE